MLLAVMHRHGGVQTSGQDVYVNVVGGLKITETGSDLAVFWPVHQAYVVKPYHNNWLFLVRLDYRVKFALFQMVKNV
jgi:predicted ATP-dependent serine protease